MKKVIITLIVFTFLFLGIDSINITAVAAKTNGSDVEEKIYSSFTLDDDFTEDSVIVVIFHEYSALDREFDKEEFPGVDIQEIIYLTSLKDPNKEYPMMDLDKYNQILELKLVNLGKENVLKAIKVLEENPLVMSAEPNLLFEVEDIIYDEIPSNLNNFNDNDVNLAINTVTPNDTYFSEQYSLKLIQAEEAWGSTTGIDTVKVGVIDSGIYNHTDLSSNLLTGWDFVNNNTVTSDDLTGHGTAAAGLIAAVGNNSQGIAGVAWNVKIVPLQVVDSNGLYVISSITSAIDYAVEENIPIINMSFGAVSNSNAYDEVIDKYEGLICCSAGNEGIDTDINSRYPSCDDAGNLICVASSTETDVISSYSNYGVITVDLVAPGENLRILTNTGSYKKGSGTSFSTPLVAGTAALLLSYNPYLSAKEMKSAIIENVDQVSSLSRKVYC